ncbi:MAG: response regulator transcription factor [Myxococcaceae bacterium]
MIRVLLVDDQALFREGLRTLLSVEPGIVVVGEAKDGHEALILAESTHPSVVLMDLRMPGMDGVTATRRLRARFPRMRVLVLTTFDDDASIFEAVRAGAVGYLLKDVSAPALVTAVHAADRGDSVLQPSVARRLIEEFNRLASIAPSPAQELAVTDREREVLKLLARGSSNKEIASALGLVEGTVKNHVTRILEKLEVADRTQAALKAREAGIV